MSEQVETVTVLAQSHLNNPNAGKAIDGITQELDKESESINNPTLKDTVDCVNDNVESNTVDIAKAESTNFKCSNSSIANLNLENIVIEKLESDVSENESRTALNNLEVSSSENDQTKITDGLTKNSAAVFPIADINTLGDNNLTTQNCDITKSESETVRPLTENENKHDVHGDRNTASDLTEYITERPNSVATCDRELEQVQKISQEMKAKERQSIASEMSVYYLKWFDWKGEQTPIVTQNENGPCPLLAIANVLILARKIVLPPMQQLVTGKQLIEYVGDCILSEVPDPSDNKELVLNFEQNMHDAIDIMYKLQTGIDVNIRFSGVTDFEFTSECIVFDLLKIVLYHGWLVDPQDTSTIRVVKDLSYNQAIDKMLVDKEGGGDKLMDALIIEEFLNRTANQLTYHGLCELNSTILNEELCVFFRNNHFSTLYKHNDELFLLVTDQGFLTEPAVIWETLINIEGDGQFVNSLFKSVTLQSTGSVPAASQTTSSNSTITEETNKRDNFDLDLSQVDRDYLVALSLQEDEVEMSPSNISDVLPTNDQDLDTLTVNSDHALALKLQQKEDRLAQEYAQQQQQQQREQHSQQSQQRQPTNRGQHSNQRAGPAQNSPKKTDHGSCCVM